MTCYHVTPCGPAPPSTEKPAMAYISVASSSENWQKYIVLLCKQHCTPFRDYIRFPYGLRRHSLLSFHLIKISIEFLCLRLLVWGLEPLVINHTLHLFFVIDVMCFLYEKVSFLILAVA